VPLEGTIETFGIGEIFELVSHQRKTGLLEINTGKGVAELSFRQGMLVEAWPDKRNSGALIGSMLIRADLISPVQLGYALDRQRDNLRRIGDILIRMGAIRVSEFQEILSLQQRETVYRLMRLKRGRFRFVPRAVEVEEGVSIPMDVGMLLMEGFRQIDEWPNLLKRIPSEKLIYSRAPNVSQPEDLNSEQSRVLALIDGTCSVREIVNRSRLGEFCAWNALADLFERGLITRSGAVWRVPPQRDTPRMRRVADTAFALLLLSSAAVLLALGVDSGRDSYSALGTALREARAEAKQSARRAGEWHDSGSVKSPPARVGR
jgi:hypothetical protein